MADPFIAPPEPGKEDIPSERVLKSLNSQYMLIGKTHVRAWKAWLTLGVVVGLVAAAILIANRSGEFEAGRTAPVPPPPAPPQKIVFYQTGTVGAFVSATTSQIQVIPLSTYYSEDGCVKDIKTPSKLVDINLVWQYLKLVYISWGGEGILGYKLTIPASVTLTHGDIPITFADIKPKDFITIEVSVDVATKQATFTKVDVTSTKLAVGTISSVTTTDLKVKELGKATSTKFALIPQTKIYIGSLAGGIKPATVSDLKAGNYVAVGWASAGSAPTGMQILMQDLGVTGGEFPKFVPPGEVAFTGYVTYKSGSRLGLQLYSVNELVNGCYKTSFASGPASALLPLLTGLSSVPVLFNADTQFSRRGIPINPVDGFGLSPESMITDATYNPTDKTWTAKSVELSGYSYAFSGQISDFTGTTLKVKGNPSLTLTVIPETKIFVISSGGVVTVGGQTDLTSGKNVWGTWIYPVPSNPIMRTITRIFVQQ